MQWVWVFDYPIYVAARQWASNPYEVFGALAAFTFLATEWEELPSSH